VCANEYVRAVTGLRIRDCTSGFRCWRRELLARLPLSTIASDGYAFQVEMAFEARRAGAVIVEAPIHFVERRQGASKLSWRVVRESIWMPWRLISRPHARRAGN
jgi:dolichol-phosphate mannosyltransferase